jgi:hypothetical protein
MRVCGDEVEPPELLALGDGGDGLCESVSFARSYPMNVELLHHLPGPW